jgi:hypothetical protein
MRLVFVKQISFLQKQVPYLTYSSTLGTFLRTDIHVTKLKLFFPLIFQVVSNHVNVYVHANFLQQFAMDMMS